MNAKKQTVMPYLPTHAPAGNWRSARGILILWIVVFLAATSGTAPAEKIAFNYDVSASISGTARKIGSMNGWIELGTWSGGTNDMKEEATFQLDADYRYLMDNSKGWQCRWVQLVRQLPFDYNYFGSPVDSPCIDQPLDGWDYQRTPKNDWQNGTPGADQAPFYENDDVAGDFKMPKYSGKYNPFGGQPNVDVHDDTLGIVRHQDNPKYTDTSADRTQLQFLTYLVFHDTTESFTQFNVLGGFGWGFGRNGDGSWFPNSPIALGPTFSQFLMDEIDMSLYNAMFPTWLASTGADLPAAVTPEPSAAVLLTVCACLLPRVRRRARQRHD